MCDTVVLIKYTGITVIQTSRMTIKWFKPQQLRFQLFILAD